MLEKKVSKVSWTVNNSNNKYPRVFTVADLKELLETVPDDTIITRCGEHIREIILEEDGEVKELDFSY